MVQGLSASPGSVLFCALWGGAGLGVYLEMPVSEHSRCARSVPGPDPEQSRVVWLLTEISHPVSMRKFKC